MSEPTKYNCVNCGARAHALYRTYGPTVLKLTKCDVCKGIVDKYIEYDPVIVMIDLVLMSKEAQRHVLYNTDFKAHLKLLVILIMVETYGVWHNNSLFNIVTNTLCGIDRGNSTSSAALNVAPLEYWNSSCWAWAQDEKTDDSDLFIWEKDFYIQFISTFAGIAVFILTVHVLMRAVRPFAPHKEVAVSRLLKAFSLAHVSVLFTLPALVWGDSGPGPGPDPDPTSHSLADTHTVHYLLVFAYCYFVFLNVFTVAYECPAYITSFILIISNIMKFLTSFHTTPQLRRLIS